MKKTTSTIIVTIILILSISGIPCFAEQTTAPAVTESESPLEIPADTATDSSSTDDPTLRWGSGDHTEDNPGTHGFITERGLIILKKAVSSAKTFYSGYTDDLITGSVLPDEDESTLTSGPYKWHFYGEDELNYMGQSTTAYTKFRNHYNDAVDYYLDGDETAAMESLGRAIHYLEDLNAPHHVLNLIASNSLHTEYEDWVEIHYSDYAISSVSSSTLNFVKNSTLKEIADDCAEYARPYIDDCEAYYLSGTTVVIDGDIAGPATNNLLRKAQRVTAGVLNKFMYDVDYL
jgi:hypothetical protein